MARGGSKPGERRGGRKKGTPNKVKDNALVMLDAATKEVRLLAAQNKLHKLGKDRLADLDGWAYDMAQRFAPTEDKNGRLFWDGDGDEIRFMRFMMFAARCAGLRAQYESPRYAAIALANQGQQTPDIYKRDPYKVMEDMVARFRAAQERDRAERGLGPKIHDEAEQQARIDALELENAALRGAPVALPAPEGDVIDPPTGDIVGPREQSDNPANMRAPVGTPLKAPVTIDHEGRPLRPGSQMLPDGRIVPIPPQAKSGAETRAQADRVNARRDIDHAIMTSPSRVAHEPVPSTGPRIVSGSGELFRRAW